MFFQYLNGLEPIFYTTHTNEEPFKIISCVNLYKICFVKNVPGSFDYFKKLATPYKD